jgi:hypothetical protein
VLRVLSARANHRASARKPPRAQPRSHVRDPPPVSTAGVHAHARRRSSI